MSRKRRYALGHRRNPKFTADRTPPTMETAIKSMPDHLRYLDPPEWAAACEIGETRQRYLVAWKDKHRPSLGMIIEGAPPRLLGGPFGKYEAWMDKVVTRYIPFNAVIEMIEGLPPWEADRKWRRPLGVSAGWLIESLRVYINLPVDAKRQSAADLTLAGASVPASKPARKIP